MELNKKMLFRYEVEVYNENKVECETKIGFVYGEDYVEAVKRVYKQYFDIILSIKLHFDEENEGVVELFTEDLKDRDTNEVRRAWELSL